MHLAGDRGVAAARAASSPCSANAVAQAHRRRAAAPATDRARQRTAPAAGAAARSSAPRSLASAFGAAPERLQQLAHPAHRRRARATGRRRVRRAAGGRCRSSPARSNAWPVSSACSASARAQKPWMVNTAARSISRSACCRRARRRRRSPAAAGAGSVRGSGRLRRHGCRHAPRDSRSARLASRAASARRRRRRSRNSWVAASVKVTARIWPTRRPRSITSRVTSVARVKVLPVPALASISCRPSQRRCRGRDRGSAGRLRGSCRSAPPSR